MSFELDPTFAADTEKHFNTLQVHAGLAPDPVTGSAALPIYATAAWQFDDAEDAAAKFALSRPGNVYSRLTNTTTDSIAARVAAIEGAAAAVAVASGHAAEILAFTNIAKAGDHIVASDSLYGGTWNILLHTLDDLGIKTTFVRNNDIDAFVAATQENTKFWYVETIGNPLVDVADVPALVDAAKSLNIPVIVDNTFATPYLYRPAADGAAVIIECHADLTAVACKMFVDGVVDDLIDQVIESLAGGTSDIHSRSFADCVQSLQNGDRICIVCFLGCHIVSLPADSLSGNLKGCNS